MTLDSMQNYYGQLILTLQTKLGQTNEKLSQSIQQLQNLVTAEEWREKQQTRTEFTDSLTNKRDKFYDKLRNEHAKKLEKLQNPEVTAPSRNIRNESTRNTNNKGNKSQKKSEV